MTALGMDLLKTLLVVASALLSMAAAACAEETPAPGFAGIMRDTDGNIHINTANTNTTVFINGKPIRELLATTSAASAAVVVDLRNPSLEVLNYYVNAPTPVTTAALGGGVYRVSAVRQSTVNVYACWFDLEDHAPQASNTGGVAGRGNLFVPNVQGQILIRAQPGAKLTFDCNADIFLQLGWVSE